MFFKKIYTSPYNWLCSWFLWVKLIKHVVDYQIYDRTINVPCRSCFSICYWNISGAEYCATGLLLCKWSLWCFKSALKWKIEGSFFFSMAEIAGEKYFRWSEIFLHVWLGFGSLLHSHMQPLHVIFVLCLSLLFLYLASLFSC